MPTPPEVVRPARVPPLAAALAALILGILLAPWGSLAPPGVLLLLAVLLCLTGALLAGRRRPALAALCLLAPVTLFGALRAHQAQTPGPSDVSRLAGKPSLWVRGTVRTEPEPGAFGASTFLLEADAVQDGQTGRAVTGRLRVTLRREAGGPPPAVGDVVAVRGRVETPRGATNPGDFDYRAYLAWRGIFATLTARRTGDLRRLRGAPRRIVDPAGWAAALRARVRGNLAVSGLPPDDTALLAGILLSDRAALPADLEDALERTGAVHVLSVSGLHLTALAGALLGALALLPAGRGGRRVARIAAALLLWVYALAAGGSSAAVRAAWMATVFLMGPVVRRHADPVHALVFAAFVTLAVAPAALFDPGAQLSFATVGTLLLWVPPLERRFLPWEPGMSPGRKAARWLCLMLLAGAVAQVGSAPLVAYHFGLFSVVAPVANLLIVPAAEGALLLGLAQGLGGVPLAWALAPLLSMLRWLALAFAAPSWVAFSTVPPPGVAVVAYYLMLGGIAVGVRRRLLVRTLFAPSADATPDAGDAPGAAAAAAAPGGGLPGG